ncbi:MAG: ATP-binding cassette domain-containing protein, partial [Burkholderiaceae bacterium]|nr:ATP-binding cassette domain-containing protein [Burkholderiaceae bacterium]
MSEFALEFLDIRCTFRARDDPGQSYTAVAETTLRIRAGEFVSVVGPTGCGKSTLLNIGAGLLPPTSGSVRVFGEPLEGIIRRAGIMVQSEALMRWRCAIDNVMVGIQSRGVGDEEARAQ